MHEITLAQETPKRIGAEPGSGLATTDQSAPFHDSIKVWFMDPGPFSRSPTAIQLVELTQDTSSNQFIPLPGLGLGTMFQALPSQDSISVDSVPDAVA